MSVCVPARAPVCVSQSECCVKSVRSLSSLAMYVPPNTHTTHTPSRHTHTQTHTHNPFFLAVFKTTSFHFNPLRLLSPPHRFSHTALFSPPPPPPSPPSSIPTPTPFHGSPSLPSLWLSVPKLIRVNRCHGRYLCFHLVWLCYKLSTGPAQCRRSV